MIETNESLKVNLRAPKRIIHFSDGVLEEYENDEEDTDHSKSIESDKQIVLVCNQFIW